MRKLFVHTPKDFSMLIEEKIAPLKKKKLLM